MIKTLSKSSRNFYISYVNGNFTDNLFGKNFQIEDSNNVINFIIDISGNFHVKNKHENSYYDIQEFSEDRNDLKTVEIDGQNIYENTVKELSNKSDYELNLTFKFNENDKHTYPVDIEISNGDLKFIVK